MKTVIPSAKRDCKQLEQPGPGIGLTIPSIHLDAVLAKR